MLLLKFVRTQWIKLHAGWAFALFHLNFEIEHISGDNNVWADLLTRWGSCSASSPDFHLNYLSLHPEFSSGVYCPNLVQSYEVFMEQLRDTVPTVPDYVRKSYTSFHNVSYSHIDDDFLWPSLDAIRDVQQLHLHSAFITDPEFASIRTCDDGIYKIRGKYWLPPTARDLQIRFCIVAHCGSSCHKDLPTTKKYLTDNVWWDTLDKDFNTFYHSCLQCAIFNPALEMRRPFGETIACTKPGQVLEFDFLHVNKLPSSGSSHKYEYILVLKDKFSKFVWLFPCVNANSAAAVDAILQWSTLFGVPLTWISDQGSHFKNEVMTDLNNRLGANHHFTTAYCPWSNGSVERVNRNVLSMIRKLLAEQHLAKDQWVYLLSPINKAINETPSRTLAGATPRTVFTGLPVTDPIKAVIYRPLQTKANQFQSIDFTTAEWADYFHNVQDSLDNFHAKIALTQRQYTALQNSKRNKQHTVFLANFEVGMFVLLGKVKKVFNNKLDAQWTGPYRVTKVINKWVYEVQDLLNEEHFITAHAARLLHYSDSSLNVDTVLLDQITYDRGDASYEHFCAARYDSVSSSWQFQVKWLGFADIENTWEDAVHCFQVDPTKVRTFIRGLTNPKAKADLMLLLDIKARNW